MKPEQPTDQPEPVAYDHEGRPLYAHPPKQAAEATNHTVVHMARMVEPVKQEVSPEVKLKHERSMRQYPFLNLSEGEYIIRAIRRHPIGLIVPLGIGVLILALALGVLFNYDAVVDTLGLQGAAADAGAVTLPILLFCILVGLGMYVVYYVYVNNKFFLTNESVIQEIQVSLFSRHEQTVSLANIEDASFRQENIIQHLFDYGSIRLSTEGDETTYRFTYVAGPKRHVAILNNAVEAFKNGRPVANDD
jgi:uncharacterized membrane protein YdbT with pleckstrin-like domain